MKRGQVTLLIIVGLILVAITAIVITYREQLSEELQKAGLIKREALETESEKITQEINNCLEEITGDAILYVANNGGSVTVPDDDARYYAKNKQVTAPKLSELEESISSYINQMIPFCIIGKTFDMKVETVGNAKTSTKITDSKVSIRVSYPVKVTHEGGSLTTGDFIADKNARLGIAYKLAVEIADMHKDKAGMCFSCLFQKSTKNNMKIEAYNPEKNENIFLILTDQEQPINNKQLVYIFAIELGGIE